MKTQVMCRCARGAEGVRTYITHSLPAEDDAATTVQATAVPVLNQSTSPLTSIKIVVFLGSLLRDC